MHQTMALMSISTWLLVPTGTPDDILTFYIINKLGPMLYVLLLIGLLLLMLHYKLTPKKIIDNAQDFFKKVFG